MGLITVAPWEILVGTTDGWPHRRRRKRIDEMSLRRCASKSNATTQPSEA